MVRRKKSTGEHADLVWVASDAAARSVATRNELIVDWWLDGASVDEIVEASGRLSALDVSEILALSNLEADG